jgi:ubiquinone/menaquinone biosynthesis C-methylase UbiE
MAKRLAKDSFLREQYKKADNLSARGNLHARFGTNPYNWFQWLFDHFTLPAQSKILELGCGPAWLWKENVIRIPLGRKIELTDLSPEMVRTAKHNLLMDQNYLVRPSFDFKVVSANAIPYKDETFEAVIANHMLYHVRNRPEAIGEIFRILKPGGIFYAATNGDGHLQEIAQYHSKWLPNLFADAEKHFSAHEFSLENGKDQLKPPFQKVKIELYDDALEVTDVEPLLAYIVSMNITPLSAKDEDAVHNLELYLKRELEVKGSIHITKSTGLFIAKKE